MHYLLLLIKRMSSAVEDDEDMTDLRRAMHNSSEYKLVKLADKICNLRNIMTSLPADWSAYRKRECFDWAARLVVGLRGTYPELEAVFDGLHDRQSEQL